MKGLVIFVAVCVATGTFPVAADNWNANWPLMSLHPLYTESELVFLPELLGTWLDNETDADFLRFETVNGKSYVLTVGVDDAKFVVEAHLLRLKEELFLDVYFSDKFWEKNGAESEGQPPIPSLHAFGRIRIEGDKLQFSTLQHDPCGGCTDEDRKESETEFGLSMEVMEGDLVLSATTEQLQEFVLQRLEEYFSFQEDDFLRRVSPPAEEESECEVDGAESETNYTIVRDKEDIR